ncbi:MAG TPA: metallophosphoesterase [Methanofastidiosum sp.]|nr:metallophosphoesterase [Methanofastidiosum sp.]
MKTFFSADLHLGHANIIKYCNRPFKDEDDMNKKLITNWNQRVKPEDIVYHIGDFCFRGGAEGGKTKAQMWEEKLNGKIIHIRGNHDVNNGAKSLITQAILEFGDLQVFATHVPPTMKLEVPEFCDFVICGHIHNQWKYKHYKDNLDLITVPIINVGVDVWKFIPIALDELIVFYQQVIRGTAK